MYKRQTSASPAPWSAFAIIDQEGRRNTFNVEIPYLGSLLAYNDFSGSYKGMNELQAEYEQQYGPGNYIPPVAPVYYAFRFMVGVGMLMILLSFLGLFLWWRRREGLDTTRWYLRALVWALPLPWLANFLGWITTEMGRQPWIVQGLLKVEDAVSPNTAGEVLAGLIGLWAVYLMLIGLDIYLLTVTARAGVHHKPDAQITAAPVPNYAGVGFQDDNRKD